MWVSRKKEGLSPAEHVEASVCVASEPPFYCEVGHCQSHPLGPRATWIALENARHLRKQSLAYYVSCEVKELVMLLP